jgi:putative inorganic carbon (hco3(-)) transporter
MQVLRVKAPLDSPLGVSWGRRSVVALAVLLIAILVVVAAAQLGDLTRKKVILIGAGGSIALLAFNYGLLRETLLFLWVFALTYNRMYYSFEGIFGDQGPSGPYWTPSDVFLVALLAIWMWERVVLKRPVAAVGSPIWPLLVPYMAVCIISMFGASNPLWSGFEFIRILKVGLICYYIRRNVGVREWWILVFGLLAAVFVQGAFGCLQMALRSSAGFLTTLGLGDSGTMAEAAEGQMAIGGWIRASGTMSHPTNLAAYFLLTVPLAFSLALGSRHRLLRHACWICSIAGFAGLVGTLCRWPTVLCVGQLCLVMLFLTAAGRLPAKRTIGILALAGFTIGLAALPFADSLYRRATDDFSDSIKFRENYVRIAMERTTPNPFFGIGLGNFAVDILKWDPEIEWAFQQEPKVRHEMGIRAFLTPHNFYLLVLTETGVFGLLTFVWFALSMALRGFRALARLPGDWYCASLALSLGILGLLGHQAVDFTLWVDPMLNTFAIICGLLTTAESLAASAQPGSGTPDWFQA